MTLVTADRRSPSSMGAQGVRVAAYIRVSTDQQATEGAGLDAQTEAILREAERRSWMVCLHTDAGISGKAMDNRDGLSAALAFVEARRGSVLVVAKLDRLTRSLLDFASILERSRRRGWALVALDLNVDTSTPAGEMLASVVASVAQYERRLIGARTRDAMAAHKRQGATYGRPRLLSSRTVRYVHRLRAAGLTYESIAGRLNARAVPTAQGGVRWYRSTVAHVLGSAAA